MPMSAPDIDETYHQKTNKTNQSQINFSGQGMEEQQNYSRKGFNNEYNAFESNLKFEDAHHFKDSQGPSMRDQYMQQKK